VTRVVRAVLVLLAGWSAVVGPASAAHAARGPVQVPKVTLGDSDGDGLPEASVSALEGGPCACRCPVMGGDAGVDAAGVVASADTRTALVVCGTRLEAAVDPAPPDPQARPRADGRLHLDPGGLGRGGPGG